MTGYAFKVDWFSEHAPSWAAVLGPRLAKARRTPVRALFLGPYEGMAAAWLLEKVKGAAHVVLVEQDDVASLRRCGTTSR